MDQTIERNKFFMLNYVFLACLVTLFLNDHYLKFAYSGWLTGKLSDAAGIVLLPMLVAFAFPRLARHASWISALLFIFWKLPFSDSIIDFYNTHMFIQTSRVVDYSDLFVLILLPIPAVLIRRIDELDAIKIKRMHPQAALLPAIVILMSTSPPPSFYYTRTQGNLACNNCTITVDFNQDEIVDKLRKVNIIFDSVAPIDPYALDRVRKLRNENVHVYRLNQLIIEKDTLRNLDFTMRTVKEGKTVINFNGMQVSDEISTWQLYKHARHYYKTVLFRKLRSTLDK